jgi:hypothetical protein
VPPLDLSIKLVPFSEMEKFGSHICGYYTKVAISKKNFYEEFGYLLKEISFLSVHLQVYQSNMVHNHFLQEKMERVYDNTDLQYLQVLTYENQKFMFFTQHRVQLLVAGLM